MCLQNGLSGQHVSCNGRGCIFSEGPQLSPWVDPERTLTTGVEEVGSGRGSGRLTEKVMVSRWANEKEEYNGVLIGGYHCPLCAVLHISLTPGTSMVSGCN